MEEKDVNEQAAREGVLEDLAATHSFGSTDVGLPQPRASRLLRAALSRALRRASLSAAAFSAPSRSSGASLTEAAADGAALVAPSDAAGVEARLPPPPLLAPPRAGPLGGGERLSAGVEEPSSSD